ncbi:MAG TPA: GntR family transcriptional regulator [Trebonia sp.]
MSASRGRQLARQILADSERDGLGPGSRLPTERQLAVDLGVSRGDIRHALAALEADGLISREVGRGTFLRAAAADDLSADPGRPPAGTDFAPADVMTIRRLLEPQAMSLVVIWATARDFGEMKRCLTGGDAAASYEEFETWDLALHLPPAPRALPGGPPRDRRGAGRTGRRRRHRGDAPPPGARRRAPPRLPLTASTPSR